MGLFSSIGKVVGGALGAAVGTAFGNPVIGAKIGSTIGGAGGKLADGKNKSSTPTTVSAPSTPTTGTQNGSRGVTLTGDIKVANTYGAKVESKEEEDPWKQTKDWYDDLGGDSSKVNFNSIVL